MTTPNEKYVLRQIFCRLNDIKKSFSGETVMVTMGALHLNLLNELRFGFPEEWKRLERQFDFTFTDHSATSFVLLPNNPCRQRGIVSIDIGVLLRKLPKNADAQYFEMLVGEK